MDNYNQGMEMGQEMEMGMESQIQESPAEGLLFLLEEVLDKYMLIKTEMMLAEAKMSEGAGLDDSLIKCLKYKQEVMTEATDYLMAMGAFEGMGQDQDMEMEDEYMEEEDEMM